MSEARKHVGIEPRHRAGCPAHDGGKCNCKPAYRAEVWSPSGGKHGDGGRIRKTFPTYSAAKGWRDDHAGMAKRAKLRTDPGPTLREAAGVWLDGAKSGATLTRSGDAYKPSALRGYDQALKLRVLPELGSKRLREITRADLQRFVAKVSAGTEGEPKPKASTVRNTLLPVRAIYRDALALGDVEHNPTTGLRLPAARGKRERIANRTEAGALIDAAPEAERALWATALYAGLRLGELRALRWRDLDFGGSRVYVRRSWDAREGPITPKSEAGKRKVPMPEALREHLEGHRAHTPATAPDALVFGRSATKPFHSDTPTQRARRAWKAAELEPLTLHDCRHTYASLMIDAGANAKALSTYMGHANIAITMDRYGHLMDGNEAEAADRFDAYLRNGAGMGQSSPVSSGLQRSPSQNGKRSADPAKPVTEPNTAV